MRSEEIMQSLRALNPKLDLKTADHPEFTGYGYLIEDEGITALIVYLENSTPVNEGSAYTASDGAAEALPVFHNIRRRFFGELDIQLGWCNGTNTKLNALEYHSGIEIDIAASDTVLLLARQQDMANGTVDTSAVRGFYLRKGQAVLLYSSTLHFAPCAVEDTGFRVAVILPKGTNTPLDRRDKSDVPLWMKNKWLLAHQEAAHLVEAGAFVGLTGDFLSLKRS